MKNKKIFMVDGVYPANTRSRRIVKTLKDDYDVKLCIWDRSSISIQNENINKDFIYQSNEGYGNKIKKVLGIMKFYIFLKEVLSYNKPDILIASQWDMLILCTLLKNKRQKLIYDNIDMPTSNINIVLKILIFIEKKCLKKVDGIIFASRFFEEKYQNSTSKKIVLENKPSNEISKKDSLEYSSNKIKISFIGTIRYYSMLKALINSVKKYEDDIEILLFGNGPDEEKLKNIVQKNGQKNIVFFGKYNYEDIAKFYNISDLIWAVYPENDYNVKYAISNKFHESIIFEKPCLFSKNTLLGDFVTSKNIGLSLEISELENIIKKIINNELDLNKLKKSIVNYKIKNNDLYWEDNEEQLKYFFKELE
ncbi:MAG: glycosyltransferase [Fusobacteriaceae bacterium]